MNGLSECIDRYPQDHNPELDLQSNGIMPLLEAGVTVVKIHNCPGYARFAATHYPHITAIHRDTAAEDQLLSIIDIDKTPPDVIANLWYRAIKASVEAAGPGVYHTWPFCEPNKGQLAKLNLIALSIMKLGIPSVIGEFSAEFNLWDAETTFKPALDQIIAGNHLLGLHAYDNPLPAPGGRKLTDSPWLYPNKRLKTKARIVITELGIDTIGSEGRPCPGWKQSGLSVNQYANWLISADQEFRGDPRVVGECVYISSRTADDDNEQQKRDYLISFRDNPKPDNKHPECVEDVLLRNAMLHIQDTIPVYDPRVFTPPVTPPEPPNPPDTKPLPPVPPKGDRVVTVKTFVNMRAKPDPTSTLVGRFEVGAKPTVTGDVSNGYVMEKHYQVWLLAANLQGV